MLKYYGKIECPIDFMTRIGANLMAKPIANSTNQFQITLVEAGARVLDAEIALTVYAPDGVTKTLDTASVPHIGEGVYSLKTPVSVLPKKGSSYQAVFHITRNTDEFNPTYYFDVYEN
jgi:hypothetical protein